MITNVLAQGGQYFFQARVLGAILALGCTGTVGYFAYQYVVASREQHRPDRTAGIGTTA